MYGREEPVEIVEILVEVVDVGARPAGSTVASLVVGEDGGIRLCNTVGDVPVAAAMFGVSVDQDHAGPKGGGRDEGARV